MNVFEFSLLLMPCSGLLQAVQIPFVSSNAGRCFCRRLSTLTPCPRALHSRSHLPLVRFSVTAHFVPLRKRFCFALICMCCNILALRWWAVAGLKVSGLDWPVACLSLVAHIIALVNVSSCEIKTQFDSPAIRHALLVLGDTVDQ